MVFFFQKRVMATADIQEPDAGHQWEYKSQPKDYPLVSFKSHSKDHPHVSDTIRAIPNTTL